MLTPEFCLQSMTGTRPPILPRPISLLCRSHLAPPISLFSLSTHLGCVMLTPEFCLVVVEGCTKSIKRYNKVGSIMTGQD